MTRISEEKENEDNNNIMLMNGHLPAAAPHQTYKNGSITKILMENFLTYDHVVCKPGPFLNVVIGPNGTGKSSVICAICLAVGGRPPILGRSDNMADFVKHGKQEGMVELSIWDANRKRDVVFTVLLQAHKNAAVHLIDGRQKRVMELREEVRKYNIQVDNPCTFLAQDKVKSFAEQGPQKLLRNTEKAGAKDLTEVHKELLETAEEGDEYEERLARLRKRMEHIDKELKAKKARVENYLEFAHRNKTLSLLKQKRALIEYQQQLERVGEAMTEVDAAKARLDNANKRLEPINKSIRIIEDSVDHLQKRMGELTQQRKSRTAEIKKLFNHAEMNEALKEAANAMAEVENSYKNWDKEKEEIAVELKRFKDMYGRQKQNFMPNPRLPSMEEEIRHEHQKFKVKELALQDEQKGHFRRQNELNTRKDEHRQLFESKMHRLESMRKGYDIAKAWDFYTRNRDKFRGPVFVPFLHVQIPDPNSLIFFNNVVATRDLSIFIFSCREDEELLLRQQGFNIDTSIVPQHLIDKFQQVKGQATITDELRQLGFANFLINCCQMPDMVGAYLNGIHYMENILIGTPAMEANYEHACNRAKQINPGFRMFLTRNFRIDVSFSRFNRQQVYFDRKSLVRINPRFGQEHTRPFDDAQLSAEWAQCQQQKKELERRHEATESEKQKLRERVLEYRAMQKIDQQGNAHLEHIRGQVERYEQRMQAFRADKPNLAHAKATYEQTKKELANQALESFEQAVQKMEMQRETISHCAVAFDELARLKERKRALEAQKATNSETGKEFQIAYREQLRALQEVRNDVDDAKKAFKELAKFSPAEGDQSREEKRQFAKMKEEFTAKNIPDDLDELEEMNRQEQSKSTRGTQEGTEKDLQDYERMKREQLEVSADLQRTKAKNDTWKAQMDEKLDDWVEELRELVRKISHNFSEFFAQLGCAGEVHLEEPENKYKIEEYGIKIFVKFRNSNSLRELSPQTQSGGERSVATMLYIMSLQNLCPVPFRCVDEINQGMDPQNERAVFNMMVNLLNTGGNVSKTQYFLLTPKLLSGLDFNDKVTVHVVHNGPIIEGQKHWDAERMLSQL